VPVTFPPQINEFFNAPLHNRPSPVNRKHKRIVPAPFLPFTLQDFASHLRTDTPVGPEITDDDKHALEIIATVVEFIEHYTAEPMLRSRWQMTSNRFEGSCIRVVYPIMESNPQLTVGYYLAGDPTTLVTLAPTEYYIADRGTIQIVNTPPAPLRATSGLVATYNSGDVDYPLVPTAPDIALAQSQVNPLDRMAAYNLMGFLFESREGDKAIPTKYQAEAKLSDLTPNIISLLLGPRGGMRLDGLV
jgi:hypothetical protein